VTTRRWALDAGLAAAIAVVTQIEIWAPHTLITPTHMTTPRAAVSVAYLLATAALVFRTRYPLGSVVFMCLPLAIEWIAFGAPESFGTFVLVMVASYSVAVGAEPRRAAVGLGILVLIGLVWTFSDPKANTTGEHLGARAPAPAQ
jgi:hypothetical protein